MAYMRRGYEMGQQQTPLETSADGATLADPSLARLLCHIRKPENLLVYLAFSAWMKFMGIAAYIPTVTIGG